MTVYDFSVLDAAGQPVPLAQYRGHVLLIVNVASKCGFTPQYEGLEALQKKYHDRGFSVLGFPCNQFLFQESGTNDQIQQFCKLKYDVHFPVFGKIKVNGGQADPLYQFLKQARRGALGLGGIKWNFTKFLVDRQGNVVERYSPLTKPESIAGRIEELLAMPNVA